MRDVFKFKTNERYSFWRTFNLVSPREVAEIVKKIDNEIIDDSDDYFFDRAQELYTKRSIEIFLTQHKN